MTKSVRIENADNSAYKVRVTIQTQDSNGEWKDGKVVYLDYPTFMATEYIHDKQRLIIEEA